MISEAEVVGNGATPAPAEVYSVAEAARELAISERTLREWIRLERIPTADLLQTQRGIRIPASLVASLRGSNLLLTTIGERTASTHGSSRQKPEGAGGSSDRQQAEGVGSAPQWSEVGGTRQQEAAAGGGALRELEARLEGAQLAARIHAQRRREETALLKADVEFLRQRLEQAAVSEKELRFIVAQTTQVLQQVTERPALPAADPRPARRVRWWLPWRR
jgi:transposase-like protein